MAASATGKPKNQQLAAKEAKLFKELLRDFEDRTYKKGLKTAEAILKKSPENGETLCMKGIITYNMGKRPEGIDLVKRGTRLDVGSHICWHVSALVWKAEKDLPQALECYSRAVKIDENQTSLVRDLISLQLQLRQLPDCLQHRVHLLALQPKYRPHWIGLAVAYHLNKRFDDALDVLRRFEAMQSDRPKHDYDYSELVLYHAMVLEESGRPQEAFELLEKEDSKITDKLGLQMHKAKLLLALKDSVGAEAVYKKLLTSNPENHAFVQGILASKGVASDSAQTLAVLDDLLSNYPKSVALRRLALEAASGDEFRSRAATYVIDAFNKGIPSTFVDLKSLYSNDEKRRIIEKIVLDYRDTLEPQTQAYSSNGHIIDSDSPTTLVWVLYFLAQHFSALGQDQKALALIDQVVAYTPTLPDIYMMKARILKRAGDAVAALAAMEEARDLDGQDRFLNGKSVKYMLRVNRIEEAEKIASLFTRDANAPVTDLTDMQCLWFLQEEGDAYRRKGNFGMALKRYHQIEKIFNDWREDEFDFHSWCLRKATIRHYIRLTRWEDQLRSHPAYYRAIRSAIEIYIDLDLKKKSGAANGDHSNADAEAELRKAQKKAKKAEAKAKSQAAAKPANAPLKKDDDDSPAPQVDDDPQGLKLANTSEPLVAASRLLAKMEQEAGSRIETWLLSFDLAMREEAHLQAIRSLRRAHDIDSSSPDLFRRTLQFDLVAAQSEKLAGPAKAVYTEVKSTLWPFENHQIAVSHLLQHLSRHSTAQRTLAAAQCSPLPEQGELAFQMLHPEVACSAELAGAAYTMLRMNQSPRSEEFRKAASAQFPLAVIFKSLEKPVESTPESDATQKQIII